MTRHRSGSARARKYPPLGILLATDDGLVECIPGARAEPAIEGYRFTSVDARGEIAAAAAPGEGVWVHNGLRWRQAWHGDARCVELGAAAMYIGTGDGHVLRSTDEGETWDEVRGTSEIVGTGLLGSGLAHPSAKRLPVTGIAEIPSTSRDASRGAGALVVAFDGGGTWLTPNDGSTWLRRGEGIDAHVQRLYRHPDITDRLYVTTHTGLYRSTDEGHTWLQSLKDLDRSWGGSLAVLPGATDSLVLSLARRGDERGIGCEGALFRTMNAGLRWQRILLDGEDEWARVPAVVRPHDLQDVAFVAAGTSLYASHDRGREWTALAEDLPTANAIAASV